MRVDCALGESCNPDDPCPEHKAPLANFFVKIEQILGARMVDIEVSPGSCSVTHKPEPKQ